MLTEETIIQTYEDHIGAINKLDTEKVLALYAEEIVVRLPIGKAIAGKPALRKALESVPPEEIVGYEQIRCEIAAAGDRATLEVTLKLRTRGQTRATTHHGVMFFRLNPATGKPEIIEERPMN